MILILCCFFILGVFLGVISPLIGFVAATRVNTTKLKDWKNSLPVLSKSLLCIFTCLLMINGSLISINKHSDTNVETALASVHRGMFTKMYSIKILGNNNK